MWLDPSDSTKLLNTVGGAITNGATIGTFNSSGGTARAFTQLGALARPTWDSSGINGLGAIRSNNQILSTATVTGFASMSGSSFLVVGRYNSGAAGTGCGLGFTMVDTITTHQPTISMVQARITTQYQFGARRVGSDAIAFVVGSSIPASNKFILGGTVDYSNALGSLFESGVKGVQDQTSFASAGTTAAGEPSYIALGAFSQNNGGVFSMGNAMDGWIGECLAWNSRLTPDQLVSSHTYLRLKWGIN
jgi:hypothetical protein